MGISQSVCARSTGYASLATGWMIGCAAFSSLTLQDSEFPGVVPFLSSMAYFAAAFVYFVLNLDLLTRYSLPAGALIATAAFLVLHGTHLTLKESLIWSPVVSCAGILSAVHIVPRATLPWTTGFPVRHEFYRPLDEEQGLIPEMMDLELAGMPEHVMPPGRIEEPIPEWTGEPPDPLSSHQELTRTQGRNVSRERFGINHPRYPQVGTLSPDGVVRGTGQMFHDSDWQNRNRRDGGSTDESESLSSENSNKTCPLDEEVVSTVDGIGLKTHEQPLPCIQPRVSPQTFQEQICTLSTTSAANEIQHRQELLDLVPTNGIQIMGRASVIPAEYIDHPTRVTGIALEPLPA